MQSVPRVVDVVKHLPEAEFDGIFIFIFNITYTPVHPWTPPCPLVDTPPS